MKERYKHSPVSCRVNEGKRCFHPACIARFNMAYIVRFYCEKTGTNRNRWKIISPSGAIVAKSYRYRDIARCRHTYNRMIDAILNGRIETDYSRLKQSNKEEPNESI